MATIGIDLGTTNSCVAVYEGGEAKIIQNKEGKNTTPSIIAFTDKGEVIVGDSAKRQAITNPENTIDSIKRIMGLKYNDSKIKNANKKTQYKIVDKKGLAAVEVSGKIYTPQELSAKILSKLKTDAETYLGSSVTDVVITVPAYFGDDQRKATQEAAVIAGMNCLRIINEPTAASLAYGIDKKEEETLCVFDFGGGTMDVSIIEAGGGTFEVLSTDGNAFLGGKDIDLKIVDFLATSFKEENGIDIRNDVMAMQRLMDEAEKAKKELSSTNEIEINLPFITADTTGPKHLVKSLTRAKFESMIEDIVDETINHVDIVLKAAKLSTSDIKEIIMVGGSTRIPLVQEKVKSFFNVEKLNNSVNPDEVVGCGAAIQAGVLQGDVKDILLLDVTPLTLSIEVMGGVSQPLIEKGTTIPCSKEQSFANAEDNQPEATIHVVQGEGKLAKDNKSLGQFNAELTPAPRGMAEVKVKFDIDANGVLTVTATDGKSGKSSNIKISGSSGLSDEEISKMVAEAESENIKNKDKIEAIEKRNKLDNLSYQIEKQIKETGKTVEDIPGLLSVLDKSKELVSTQSEDNEEIEKNINELEEIFKNIQQTTQDNPSQENQEKKKEDDDIIDAEVE